MKATTRVPKVPHLLWMKLFLLAVCLQIGQIGFGQTTSQLTGIVNDQTGAVIPRAEITLKSDATGDVRHTVSNSDGYFAFAAVPAGSYTVIIESTGFARWERKGVVLNPGDKRTISDIALGATVVHAEVGVTATQDQIAPVDTGEKSAVINEKQIQNLSLVGRNAAELIKVLPGFSPLSTGANGENQTYDGQVFGINGNGDAGKQSFAGNYSANGMRTDTLDIAIDGARATDPGCNCATPINPNIDMIQEFKVQQANFGAENARGPVVISAVSKGGTSEYHGSAYLYARNYALYSNSAENKSIGLDRPENAFYFPGFFLSGPVSLPKKIFGPLSGFNKNKNKLFFSVGFEYISQRLDTGIVRSWVPTDAMRNGDFSDTAYLNSLIKGSNVNQAICSVPDPTTGALPSYCAGPNKLAPAAIDPGGRVLINLLPKPNLDPKSNANGYNYADRILFDQNNTQMQYRADYSISDNTKFYVKYARQAETQPFPVGLWWRNDAQVPYPTSVVAPNRSHSITSNLTHIFSPTLTNEVVFGLSYITFPNQFQDPSKVSKEALGYPYQGPFKNGVDQIVSFTTWGGGPTLLNPSGFQFPGGLFATKWLPSISDNLSKVYKTHTLKFGFYSDYIINDQPTNNYAQGLAVFSQNGGITTNAFANMLLGSTSSYQQDNKDVLQNIGYKTFQFYGQDSWKIKPRLTLEYGLRVAHLGPWTDREGIGLAVFDPVKYKDNPDLPGVSWHDLDKSIPVAGRNVDTLFWMPRIGFAYDIFGTGKTVLRGGAGVYYFNEAQGAYSAAAATAGGKRGTTLTNLTLAEIENQNPAGLPPSDITVVDPNDRKQPRTISYSLTVTQMLPLGIQFEASYVGNHSNFMSNDGKSNANYIPLGSLYLDSNGIPLANPDSSSDAALRVLNNIYGLNYGAINLIQHNTYSNYNGLHVLASRQIGRVNFSTSYTFSKALGVRGINGVGGSLTDTNLSLGRDRAYGPLGLDRTHVFSMAYVINLPSFGKNYFKNNRLARGVLDGWEMTGISQIASGSPIQAYNSNFGLSFTYTGFPEGYIGYNQRLVMGSTDFGLNPLLTCDPRSGLGKDQYMNLNCFAPPVQLVPNGGTYDTKLITNGPLVEPYAKGPAFFNNDLSVFKNWELSERKKMQFRISAFNLTNTPLKSLTTANTLLNYQFTRDPATGNVTGAWDAGTQANFGRFTDTKFGKRTIQLAIKFFF